MSLFPTQYSTLSAAALNAHLRSAYGLEGITTKFLVRNVSDTYIIRDTEPRYVFKVFRSTHRTYAQLQGEVALLLALKTGKGKVAVPIADQSGDYIQAFEVGEGTRHGILYAYAEGKVHDDLTGRQLWVLGQEMAFNHNITAELELPHPRPVYNVDTTVHQPLEVLRPAFEAFNYPEGYAYLQEVGQTAVKTWEAYDTNAFSYGYCHYDYLPKNLHLTDLDLMTLFDFDFAGQGPLVNDLMSFQVHFFFKVTFGGMSKEQAAEDFQLFVSTYRKSREISEEELATIPCLGVMYWIFYLAVHYEGFDDFSNPYFNQAFLKRWVRKVEQWVELYGV